MTGMPRMAVGLALLNMSAWIRRQPWLRSIYRHFPQTLRNRVSDALARRSGAQIKFKRTPNWQRLASAYPSSLLAVTDPCKFGSAAGVNVLAYARGQSGLGESARLYVQALRAVGYPVAVRNIDIGIPHDMDDTSMEGLIRSDMPYGINLIFVNPDYLDAAIASIGRGSLVGRYSIACWFWELESFPAEWTPALQIVDEIMVSSDFIRKAIEPVTDKPMLHVPLPVGEVDDHGLRRSDFGLDENAFVFLTSFDFNSFVDRKNPLGTVEAFRRAFGNARSDVQLLVKSSNGHRHPEKLRQLLNAVAGDRRILVRDEVIGRKEFQALQKCVDAYVSLHRAEGFGLGIAECMHMGKPVIATGWSGNMEYMTAGNSCLVDYELIPVGEGEYLHYQGQRWADPDVSHAADYMRRLVADPQFRADIGAQAAFDMREKLSPQAAAQKIIQRLQALSPTLAACAPIGAAAAGARTHPTHKQARFE